MRAIVTGALKTSALPLPLNVGTEINRGVYNTLAAWYNEDADDLQRLGLAAGNGTLPLAPMPPGEEAPPEEAPAAQSPGDWLRSHIYVPVIPAVLIGCAALALCCALGALCCRGSRK